MILLNLDFIDHELKDNTIRYLNEEQKNFLLNEGKKWGFDGKGFSSSAKLKAYIEECGYIDKKAWIKDIESESRRVNEGTIRSLYKLFNKNTPLYIDTVRLYEMMLVSSSLMFTPNEKIFLTIMLKDPYKHWTVCELSAKAKKNHSLKLKDIKIEESLDRHIERKGEKDALIISTRDGDTKYYQIHFTNLFYYIRQFENK